MTDVLSSVCDFIRYATSRFNAAHLSFSQGFDSALDEGSYLVLTTLNLPHDLPPVYAAATLLPEERAELLRRIALRVDARVPVAYITGEAWFAGMAFKVSPDVLIPRSPIAELIERLAKVPVGFADLQLGVFDSTGAFTVLPTRRFGLNAEDLGVRVMAFDRRPGEWPRSVRLHWRVVDETGNAHAQGDTAITVGRATEAKFTLRPSCADLIIDDYVFELERVEGKSRWRTTRSFDVEESGPPRGREFTQMLDALAYIAEASEEDAMRNLTPEQQLTAWERFWRRRDPTPETIAEAVAQARGWADEVLKNR